MGLLDTVLGAVTGGQQQQQPQAGGLGGMLGGLGGSGALIGVLGSLLANNGQAGGLGGLVEKFNSAGLSNVVSSWIGKGENMPVSGDQLKEVLGSDMLSGLAAKMGMDPHAASGQLASVLPGLIDQLTPHGVAPEGGLGDHNDLSGMLGKLGGLGALGGLLHKS